MRIGFYLAYQPTRNMSLKQEGLGRYLAELTQALVNNNDEIVIACPKWTVNIIEELFDDYNIDRKNIQYVTPKAEPVFYKLFTYYICKDISKRTPKVCRVPLKLIDVFFALFLTIKNYLAFFALSLCILILFILLMPLALLGSILLSLCYIGIKISEKITSEGEKYQNTIKSILKSNQLVYQLIKTLKNKWNISTIINLLRLDASKDLIRQIDNMKQAADLWYCPMSFWPEFNEIKSKKVLCVPDLVTARFATNFSISGVECSTNEVRKTIQKSDFCITYCDYVKRTLLIDEYNKSEENIISIPHAINETLSYINVNEIWKSKESRDFIITRYCKNEIDTVLEHCPEMKPYLVDNARFSIKDIHYLFYSSQARGSKNILNLIKAYEYLLRVKNVPLKLLLTCNLGDYPPLKEYVYKHGLQYDVLCFKRVTNKQLAILYRCADLVVNPTLYEGGFPFTFGEGMSVGTPSLMGKIPQVLDVVRPYGLETYFFDPYNYLDIAEKTYWAIEHIEELYDLELPLYQSMQKRSWKSVGQDYVTAFNYFINK